MARKKICGNCKHFQKFSEEDRPWRGKCNKKESLYLDVVVWDCDPAGGCESFESIEDKK